MEKATFGAGCFWGVEAAFRKLKGVIETQVGYMGGTTKNPTYEDVCSGETGHVEAVEVAFDPKKISYQKILDAFWTCHDPTQKNRQGWDIGEQYRSVIFFHSQAQETQAKKSKERYSKKFRKPIATLILPATSFTRAEEYHQQYLEKKDLESCHI